MNELQRCQFEMLKIFIQICQQMGLRYYLVCGSALGAVKYGGFIPWDDDVDVALPRKDYEQFLKHAADFLPEHLFLQNHRTDPAFPHIFTKLRNSATTYVEKTTAHLPINHGIFIDIFPLDGYPRRKREQVWLEIRKWIFRHILNTAFSEPERLHQKIEFRIKRAVGLHRNTARIAEDYETLVSSYSCEDSKLWCNHGNWQGRKDYLEGICFGSGADAVFEGLTVKVPKQADAYLRRKYGDYHQDPPREGQRGHHFYTVLDCSHPFREYFPLK